MRALVIIAAGIVLRATPAAAEAPRPSAPSPPPVRQARSERTGLTADVASGAGMMASRHGGAIGLPALNVSVGAFLTPRTVASIRFSRARVSMTTVDGDDIAISQSSLSLSLQRWIMPRLYLGGGVGFAAMYQVHWSSLGPGISARVGYDLVTRRRLSVQAGVEILEGIYDDPFSPTLFSATATLGVQVY